MKCVSFEDPLSYFFFFFLLLSIYELMTINFIGNIATWYIFIYKLLNVTKENRL